MERPRSSPSWLEALFRESLPKHTGLGRRLLRPRGLDGALEELQALADWRRLPAVLPLAFAGREDVAAVARGVLERLLAAVPLMRLPWLDKAVRREEASGPWNPRYLPDWVELRPEHVAERAAVLGSAALALCTFHRSGWVRAAALAELQGRFPEMALPFLVLRLSDWVPAVHSQAGRACAESVVAGNERAWTRVMPLLELLERTARARSPELTARVHGLLATEPGRAALREALGSNDALARAFAFRELLAGPERGAGLVSAALRDPDPRINRLGAAALAPARFTRDLLPALRVGLRARPPFVRRECLDRLVENTGVEAAPEILDGLRDRTALVRGVAQFHATRLGVVKDLPSFYVALLGEPSTAVVEVAISSLSELGSRQAWSRVQPFLWARAGRLRRAALRAGVELEPGGMARWLWSALVEGQPSVARLARALLARQPLVSEDTARAVRIATGARRPEVARANAVRLLERTGKWEQVVSWLRIARRTDGPIRALSLEELVWWNRTFNRSFVRPRPEDLTTLSEELTLAQQSLPPSLHGEITLALNAWVGG